MLNKNNYIVRSYTCTSLCALYHLVDKIILHHIKRVMLRACLKYIPLMSFWQLILCLPYWHLYNDLCRLNKHLFHTRNHYMSSQKIFVFYVFLLWACARATAWVDMTAAVFCFFLFRPLHPQPASCVCGRGVALVERAASEQAAAAAPCSGFRRQQQHRRTEKVRIS